ncbi:MAG: hypothetical protein JXR96_26415 [Deltaproteobacteria bacterium]|nr:hypothetical protein [Deltaproteobacteria bacterium]
MSRTRLLGIFAWLLVVCGCRYEVEQAGLTGVELSVELSGHAVDQLLISGIAGREPAFDPGTLPAEPRQLGPERESLTVLLSPDLAGETLLVRADGLLGGERVASGAAPVVVERGVLVPLSISLGPAAFCGDGRVAEGIEECDDQDLDGGDGCSALCLIEAGYACDDGQPSRCEPICDATSCPDGCCDGSQCRTRSLSTCGLAGADCTACDTAAADNCSAGGDCACGMRGAACLDGQRCVSGACICDAYSCDGCCDGPTCRRGDEDAFCGSGGVPCEDCSPGICGAAGVCSGCNAETCPDGCCTGATCHSPPALAHCGLLGEACVDCDALRSDNCSPAGACLCGTRAACRPGQRCSAGACICDPASCAGCCDAAGACRGGDEDALCGAGGAPCEDCSPGACEDGGVCSGCNAETCASGCCVGATCHQPSLEHCGAGGEACASCDPDRADACAQGECVCGQEAACGECQHCLGGACRCDPLSCPGCCRGADCLAGTTDESCGRAGAACADCRPSTCEPGGVCSTCSAETCADGCCVGASCHAPPSFEHCGMNGQACVACDRELADACGADGTCRCGQGPACAEGQRCEAALCACDASSCDGCCDARGLCQPGTSNAACGLEGSACADCQQSSSTCHEGECLDCGAQTCPEGCCENNTCQPGDSKQACGTGGEACAKCHGAERCTEHACQIP